MKIKSLCLLLVVLFLCVDSAFSYDTRLKLSRGDYPETAIDYFEVIQRTETGIVQMLTNQPPTTIDFEFDVSYAPDEECKTFYIVAVRDGIPSKPSNPKAWCKPYTMPAVIVRPEEATVELIEEVN